MSKPKDRRSRRRLPEELENVRAGIWPAKLRVTWSRHSIDRLVERLEPYGLGDQASLEAALRRKPLRDEPDPTDMSALGGKRHRECREQSRFGTLVIRAIYSYIEFPTKSEPGLIRIITVYVVQS